MAPPTLGRPAGNLWPRGQVIRENYAAGRTVRDNLENIPDRLCGQLSAETDVAVVRALLADEIRSTLESLTKILRQGAPREKR